MGVRGLSSFVKKNKELLLSQHKLHDTKIIIDGKNFMYYLLENQNEGFKFGGNYDQYANIYKSFFNTLRKCNVRPYVVFDGGSDPDERKLQTVLKRRQARIDKVYTEIGSVLPILAFETLQQVLDELDIPHVSCQFEADREIAVLAHRWKCPVLSNDSDFFIYSLEGGVIPFDYINLTLCNFDSESGETLLLESDPSLTQDSFIYIPVELYHYSRFAQKYPEDVANLVLPVFGSLLGNDYVDFKQLFPFYNAPMQTQENPKFVYMRYNDKRDNRMRISQHWLEQITTRETVFDGVLEYLPNGDRNEVRTKLSRSLEDYCNIDKFASLDLEKFFNLYEMPNHERNLESFAFNELLDYHERPIPDWLVSSFRCCKIGLSIQNAIVVHRVIHHCQMELMGMPTAYTCSQRIRKITYGLLFPDKINKEVSRCTRIVEHDRKDKRIVEFYVSPMWQVESLTENWNIYTTPSPNNKEARLQILLRALKYRPRALFRNHTFSYSIISVVCMLCMWIKRAEPKVAKSAVMSVLATVLYLNVKTLHLYKKELKEEHDAPPRPRILDDVEIAFEKSNASQIREFMKNMEKYTLSLVERHNYGIVHGLSQFQAILIDTIQLNQLLACPLPLFSPGYIYSGTTVYNLCTDLDYSSNPELFVAELMVHKSPLHQMFTDILQVVLKICTNDPLTENSYQAHKKSRKKKKGKKSELVRETGSDDTSNGDTSKIKKTEVVNKNVPLTNRFSGLAMY